MAKKIFGLQQKKGRHFSRLSFFSDTKIIALHPSNNGGYVTKLPPEARPPSHYRHHHHCHHRFAASTKDKDLLWTLSVVVAMNKILIIALVIVLHNLHPTHENTVHPSPSMHHRHHRQRHTYNTVGQPFWGFHKSSLFVRIWNFAQILGIFVQHSLCPNSNVRMQELISLTGSDGCTDAVANSSSHVVVAAHSPMYLLICDLHFHSTK